MTTTPGPGFVWRKSSASQSTNCVEVALAEEGEAILVRNSNSPGTGTLRFTAAEWDAFLIGVRRGEFDL